MLSATSLPNASPTYVFGSSMAGMYACEHTCGCAYQSAKRSDRNKHERTRHRNCNEECKRYAVVTKPTIRIHTPDSFSAMAHDKAATSTSSSGKRLRADSLTPSTSSTSSTSTRKRSRPATPNVSEELPTPEMDLEESLKREKAARATVFNRIKLCCVLDPTRAVGAYGDIDDHSCWVDTWLPGGATEVEQLVCSGELEGYAFRHPLYTHTVRMYDWVSRLPSSGPAIDPLRCETRRTFRTAASVKLDTMSSSGRGTTSRSCSKNIARPQWSSGSGVKASIASLAASTFRSGTTVIS